MKPKCIAIKKSRDVTPKEDPLVLAVKYEIAILFSKSKSPKFPLYLAIARGATFFQETTIEGLPVYFAAFNRTLKNYPNLVYAVNSLAYLSGTQVFLRGIPLYNTARLSEILGCFNNRLLHSEQTKEQFCYRTERSNQDGDRLLQRPCQCIRAQSMKDLQDQAQESILTLCPEFDKSQLRFVDERTAAKQVLLTKTESD